MSFAKTFPRRLVEKLVTKWYNREIEVLRRDINTALLSLEALIFGERRGTVVVATAAALGTCVAAGSGVGKTLTASANGALTVDGYAVQDTEVILVKNQVDTKDNGIYTVTDKGDGSSPFILTRTTGYDTNAEWPALQSFYVQRGTANGGKSFYQSSDAVDVDAAPLTFTELSKTAEIGGFLDKSFFVPTGAAANHDFALPTGTWEVADGVVYMVTAGEVSDTIQLFKGASALSDAMAASGSAGALVRPASLDPAQNSFIGGTNALRVTTTDNDAGSDVASMRVNVRLRRTA